VGGPLDVADAVAQVEREQGRVRAGVVPELFWWGKGGFVFEGLVLFGLDGWVGAGGWWGLCVYIIKIHYK
jgi:hypothetical protein